MARYFIWEDGQEREIDQPLGPQTLPEKRQKVRGKRKYFDFLDGLDEEGIIRGPDTLPNLLGKFPELDRITALNLINRWAEQEANK